MDILSPNSRYDLCQTFDKVVTWWRNLGHLM